VAVVVSEKVAAPARRLWTRRLGPARSAARDEGRRVAESDSRVFKVVDDRTATAGAALRSVDLATRAS